VAIDLIALIEAIETVTLTGLIAIAAKALRPTIIAKEGTIGTGRETMNGRGSIEEEVIPEEPLMSYHMVMRNLSGVGDEGRIVKVRAAEEI
jgi:hypothetical protein